MVGLELERPRVGAAPSVDLREAATAHPVEDVAVASGSPNALLEPECADLWRARPYALGEPSRLASFDW